MRIPLGSEHHYHLWSCLASYPGLPIFFNTGEKNPGREAMITYLPTLFLAWFEQPGNACLLAHTINSDHYHNNIITNNFDAHPFCHVDGNGCYQLHGQVRGCVHCWAVQTKADAYSLHHKIGQAFSFVFQKTWPCLLRCMKE